MEFAGMCKSQPIGNLGSFSGPAWLTGGTVGPEGSILCTLFLAALFLALNRWFREAKPCLSFS